MVEESFIWFILVMVALMFVLVFYGAVTRNKEKYAGRDHQHFKKWMSCPPEHLNCKCQMYPVHRSGVKVSKATNTEHSLELTAGECEAVAVYWARRKGGRDDTCNGLQGDTGSGRAVAGCTRSPVITEDSEVRRCDRKGEEAGQDG